MGCKCSYNQDNQNKKQEIFYDDEYKEDNYVTQMNRNKSIQSNTSQDNCKMPLSIPINRSNSIKEQQSKVDLLGFNYEIIEEYNIARKYPKFYSTKLKAFAEKLQILETKDQQTHILRNSKGISISIRNADVLIEEAIIFMTSLKPMDELITDDLLMHTAKMCQGSLKLKKEDRVNHLRKCIVDLSKKNSGFSQLNRLIGFGDFDPGMIVCLQILDYKEDFNCRKAIFNSQMKYVGVHCLLNDKLNLITVTDIAGKSL